MTRREKLKFNPFLVNLHAIASLYKIDLELFQEYYINLESKFKRDKEDIVRRFELAVEKIDEEEVRDQLAEIYGEDHHIVDRYFIKYFRYSSIMALHSFLENSIRYYAKFLKRALEIEDDIPNRGGMKSYKKYIKDNTDFCLPTEGAEWSVISDFIKIRDCLIHCDGHTYLSKDEEYLKTLDKKYDGISFHNETEMVFGSSYFTLVIDSVGIFLKKFEEQLLHGFKQQNL